MRIAVEAPVRWPSLFQKDDARRLARSRRRLCAAALATCLLAGCDAVPTSPLPAPPAPLVDRSSLFRPLTGVHRVTFDSVTRTYSIDMSGEPDAASIDAIQDAAATMQDAAQITLDLSWLLGERSRTLRISADEGERLGRHVASLPAQTVMAHVYRTRPHRAGEHGYLMTSITCPQDPVACIKALHGYGGVLSVSMYPKRHATFTFAGDETTKASQQADRLIAQSTGADEIDLQTAGANRQISADAPDAPTSARIQWTTATGTARDELVTATALFADDFVGRHDVVSLDATIDGQASFYWRTDTCLLPRDQGWPDNPAVERYVHRNGRRGLLEPETCSKDAGAPQSQPTVSSVPSQPSVPSHDAATPQPTIVTH